MDNDGSGDLEVTADLKILGDHKRGLLGVFRNKLTVFIKSRFTRSTDDDVEGLAAGIEGLGYPPAVVALKNVREASKGRFKSFTAGKTRLAASETSFDGTGRAATIAGLDIAVVAQFSTSNETITTLGHATSEGSVTSEGNPGNWRLRGGLLGVPTTRRTSTSSSLDVNLEGASGIGASGLKGRVGSVETLVEGTFVKISASRELSTSGQSDGSGDLGLVGTIQIETKRTSTNTGVDGRARSDNITGVNASRRVFASIERINTVPEGALVNVDTFLARSRAVPSLFKSTSGRASVTGNFISIITSFSSAQLAITTGRCARLSRGGTSPTIFNNALGRATIVRYEISIVASFSSPL